MTTLPQYFEKHDGKPRPDGPELIRLSNAVGTTSTYMYLAALGHKQFGPNKAVLIHTNSIGGELKPEAVRSDYEYIREAAGIYWRKKSS